MTDFTTFSSTRTRPAAALTTVYTLPCGPYFDQYDSSCAPPNWTSYWGGNVGYYSPAICPSGWTIACGRFASAQGPALTFGESAGMCAPSGYTCCGASYTSVACKDTLRAASSLTSYQAFIQIRWASSDLSILETDPVTPGKRNAPSTSTPPTDPTTSTTAGPQTSTGSGVPNPGGGGSSGLGTGAIAGIAIAVVVLVLGVIAAAVFIFFRKRKAAEAPAAAFAPGGDPAPKTAYATQPYTTGSDPTKYAAGGGYYGAPAELENERSPPSPRELYASPTATQPYPLPPAQASELHSNHSPPNAGQQPYQQPYQQPIQQPYPVAGSQSPPPPHQQWPAPATYPPVSEQSVVSSPPITHSNFNNSPGPYFPPSEPSAVSSSPPPPSAEEVERLKQQYAELEAKRKNLMQLQQLEEEQAALRQKISALQGAGGPSTG
ncbi:hypothetical protein B0H63DRAFT_452521 [Podospora didyma]|uniref:Uncharacterized protein n=1 Tax=Podospora didyma TaxID=330526 RepID=A0AAE0KDS5_9PEZI|nr:hypothetical protein B0H63DRAFT_452521 [Podospora didyma]